MSATLASQATGIARAYARRIAGRTGADFDDVESDACWGAFEALRTWWRHRNPYRNFGGLVNRCVQRAIADGFKRRAGRLRRERRALQREDPDEPRGRDVPYRLVDEVWGLVGMLPDAQRMAMRFVYFFGWYDREVGEYFGRSPSWARDMRHAAIARIKAHYWGEELSDARH